VLTIAGYVRGFAIVLLLIAGRGVLAQSPTPSAVDPEPFLTAPTALSTDSPPANNLDSQPSTDTRPARFPTSLGSGIGGGGLGGGYGNLSSPLGEQDLFWPRVNYAATWYPGQPVKGQNTDLSAERQDLSISVPVWRDGPDALSVSTNVRSVLYQTSAILPDTHQPFPGDLWNISVGANYRHTFDNGWTAGGMVNFGSASDRPFDSLRDMEVSLGGFLRIPAGEDDAWMFGAMYSPTGELAFPIPIISYYWQPSDQFSMNIGLPFSLRWRPIEDLQFDFSYVPIRTVHTRITYRLMPGLGVYTGYDWNNESYFLSDRTDSQDRFFYYEQRVIAGFRYDITPRAAFDLSGGYAFDRYFFEGTNSASNQQNRVDVGNGAFMSLRFQIQF
jgi:hypothetical protein